MTPADRHHLSLPDGTRLSYLTAGSGAPVVLIAGWPMDATWWVEDGYVEALAATNRVIAVDPLGSGESDKPLDVAAYGDDQLVGHLGAVLEAEVDGPCTLWGWGRGAMIAQLYARRRPNDVALVVCGGEYLGTDRRELAAVDVDPHVDNDELVDRLEAADWDAVWRLFSDPPEWFTTRSMQNDPYVLATVLRASRRRPQGFLPSSVPTIAIWGSEEPAARQNLELAESIPLAATVVVPGDRFEAYRDVAFQLEVVGPHLAEAATSRID